MALEEDGCKIQDQHCEKLLAVLQMTIVKSPEEEKVSK